MHDQLMFLATKSRAVLIAFLAVALGVVVAVPANAESQSTESKTHVMGVGVSGDQFRWADRTVVYEFEANYPGDKSVQVIKAFSRLTSRTDGLIKFKKRGSEKDYVKITNTPGCGSDVGKLGGVQTMSLGAGCTTLVPVLHAAMQTLGVYDEHVRPDRDNFVTVHWDNIKADAKFSFEKFGVGQVDTFGTAFDCDSVMMPPRVSAEYSIDGKPAYTPVAGGCNPNRVGKATDLSAGDVKTLQAMYHA